MKIITYIITALITFLFLGISYASQNAILVDIHDGDTITVKYTTFGKKVKIRLYGIDAPEIDQPYGKNAKKHLKSLLSNKNIIIHNKGTDIYKRPLATVTANNCNVNLQMVEDGYAWHYVQYSKSKELKNAQKYAQQNKLGLWKQTNPQEPWVYRRKNRDSEYANNKPLIKSPFPGIAICFNPNNYKISIRSDNCPKGQITIMK